MAIARAAGDHDRPGLNARAIICLEKEGVVGAGAIGPGYRRKGRSPLGPGGPAPDRENGGDGLSGGKSPEGGSRPPPPPRRSARRRRRRPEAEPPVEESAPA